MVGIVLISHGKMATGVKDSAALIFGDVADVQTASLVEGQSFDLFKQEVLEAVTKAEQGDGVLVIVDLFGASPYNASMYAKNALAPQDKKVAIVTGMNLSMVVELLAMRAFSPLEELADLAINSGREGIQKSVDVQEVQETDDY